MDNDGYVAEGSVMNIGIVTREGELVVPPFEHALAGCTLKRLLYLLREVAAYPLCFWAFVLARIYTQACCVSVTSILCLIEQILH